MEDSCLRLIRSVAIFWYLPRTFFQGSPYGETNVRYSPTFASQRVITAIMARTNLNRVFTNVIVFRSNCCANAHFFAFQEAIFNYECEAYASLICIRRVFFTKWQNVIFGRFVNFSANYNTSYICLVRDAIVVNGTLCNMQ